MSIPGLDLSSIFWSAVADFVLSTMIFLIFRIRKVTLIFNVVISFVIPYLSIMFFINSKPPVEQAVPVIGNYIVFRNFIHNRLNCLSSEWRKNRRARILNKVKT